MKKFLGPVVFLIIFTLSMPAYAENEWGTYFNNMGRDLKRGFINMVSSPLEIPIGIQKAHESAGYPGVRHFEGFLDGSFNTLKRFGSGFWDWVVAWVPSDQEGVPLKPETLF